MCEKYDAVLKSSCEKSDLLTNFEKDFQQVVTPVSIWEKLKHIITINNDYNSKFCVDYVSTIKYALSVSQITSFTSHQQPLTVNCYTNH